MTQNIFYFIFIKYFIFYFFRSFFHRDTRTKVGYELVDKLETSGP